MRKEFNAIRFNQLLKKKASQTVDYDVQKADEFFHDIMEDKDMDAC